MPKKRGSKKRRWLIGPLISLMVVVLIDQVAVRIALAKEVAKGQSLPPFGLHLNADQEAWLESIQGEIGERRNSVFLVDHELGWTNASAGDVGDGLGTTNSRGFRGQREYADEKPPGVVRIACFGDSYTWGADVGDADSYPAAMESLRPDVEAPNLGVSGYGTDQALLRFRREGPSLDLDAAVLGIMVENIGRNVNRYRPLWVTYSAVSCVKPRFILERDQLRLIPSPFHTLEGLVTAVRDGSVVERTREHEHWHTRPELHFLARSPTARFIGGYFAREERNVENLWRDQTGEPFRVTRAIIEAFQREALEAGCRTALVVLFPHRSALQSVASGERGYWEDMLEQLEESGVDVLDVTPFLVKEHQSKKAQGQRAPIYTGRNHLRPHYNRVVAQAVLDRLDLASELPPR